MYYNFIGIHESLIPLKKALDQNPDRPDFSIGTDSYHTPKYIVEASKSYFESKGFTLVIDKPYSGLIVPMDYYRKDSRVISIMIEVNRKLYLNEPKNEKSVGYEKTKQIVQGFLAMLKTL